MMKVSTFLLAYLKWTRKIGYCLMAVLALTFVGCEPEDPIDDDDDETPSTGLYGGPGAGTITIENCTVTNDFVFENSSEIIDYVINCELEIKNGANVIVEPGTVISFGEKGAIILTDGSFKAVGTITESIYFIGEQDVRGWWDGIFFNTNNPENQLEFVTVANGGKGEVYVAGANAGYRGPANVTLNQGQLSMKNTNLSKSAAYGFRTWQEDAVISNFVSNTITDNAGEPISISANQLRYLDGASDYSGNNEDYVRVWQQIVRDDQTYKKLNVPYRFEKIIDVKADIVIEAGADLTFKEGAAIVVEEGSLKVEGTADAPVQFRGEVEAKGYWNGLFYNTTNPNNLISHAIIADAGKGTVYVGGGDSGYRGPAGVTLNQGRLGIINTTIKNSGSYGFRTWQEAAVIEAFSNNTFTGNKEAPISISSNQLGSIEGNNDFVGNTDDYIRVWEAPVKDDQNWNAFNVPVRFEDDVDIEANVTIQEGAKFIFAEGAALILVSGSFQAIGTSTARITFAGEFEVDGHWNGLLFNTNNSLNELSFVDIAHAGKSTVYVNGASSGYRGNANIYVNTGKLKVNNCNIYESKSCGIRVREGAELIQSDNLFESNKEGDICL